MTHTAPTVLNTAALSKLSASVRVPSYDRSKVGEAIVHIGVGGFHRAHQAVYLDDLCALEPGTEWGLCGVGIMPADEKMREALSSQDGLFTVVERSAAKDEARIVGSIKRYLLGPARPDAVIEKLAADTTKIVTLTVTEGGYCFNQGTGEFDESHPGVQHDLASPATPRTVFGYLAAALQRRSESGRAPFTVLSCDNIVGNGNVTRKMLVAFCSLRDPKLARWIEQNGAFPNSMVDRITPVTRDEDRRMVTENFGILDAWPVVTEPFKQWIVEDTFTQGRPRWEQVGVQMTGDVHPYEMMKIRLLNAGHSALGYLGYLAGYRFIHEIACDREFGTYLRAMMDNEVTPLLKPVPGVDLDQYKSSLIERFSNPTIKDQATRICMDGSNKLPKFVLPSIRERLARGESIARLTLCIAAWFRFLEGTDEEGQPIPLDDPMGPRLRELAAAGRNDPAPLLSLGEIFGDLAQSQVFVGELKKALDSLYSRGARATLQSYLA